jgi:transcriptional regulator with XRE-family HTH domain
MAKRKEKETALTMRAAGQSYSQIKKALNVSKSSLSYWLRDYPLPEERIRELQNMTEARIERTRETKRKKKESILAEIYRQEKATILPLSRRELFLSGLFLYWGEGAKTDRGEISLSNTNPAVIQAFMRWLTHALEVELKAMIVKLHLYSDMDVAKETAFWAKKLNLSKSQFIKPYIKESKFSAITYKNGHGHGTCNLFVRGATFQNKVFMGLKVLSDFFKK